MERLESWHRHRGMRFEGKQGLHHWYMIHQFEETMSRVDLGKSCVAQAQVHQSEAAQALQVPQEHMRVEVVHKRLDCHNSPLGCCMGSGQCESR